MKRFMHGFLLALMLFVVAGCEIEPSDSVIVDISATLVRLQVAQTEQLETTVTPQGGYLAYISDNTDVATVDATGLVTGVGLGFTAIRARVNTAFDYVIVEVYDPTQGNYVLDGVNVDSNGQLILTFESGMTLETGIMVNDYAIGIVDAMVNTLGELIITLSDDTVLNLGVVVGQDGSNGQDGNDGREVVFRVDSGKIQWQYVGDTVWTDLVALVDISGTDGLDGLDGSDGVDGIGIKSIVINASKELVITLTDDTAINLGVVVGSDGQDGSDGREVTFRVDSGKIQWQYVGDTAWTDLVALVDISGTDGLDGLDGSDGVDGIGIKSIIINASLELVITLTDDTVINLGVVVGSDGQDGADGQDGTDGLSAYELYLLYYPGYTGTEAQWIREWVLGTLIVDITLSLDGGTMPSGSTTSFIALKGEVLVVPDPSKPFSTFLGWYEDAAFTTLFVSGDYAESTFTLYAKWETTEYDITYVLDGGTNSIHNPATYSGLSSTIVFDSPTKLGYTFQGWYSEATFVTLVEEIVSGSEGDVTLYAKWALDTYEITYVLDGGTNAVLNPSSYNVHTPTITLLDATKLGYTFMGWYIDPLFVDEVETIDIGSTGDLTLYALFLLDTYDITYVLDDGLNDVGNPATYDVNTPTITLLDASKYGYTFDGWFLEASFTTEVTQIVLGSVGDVTLYAKFSPVVSNIVYVLNGGVNGANPSTYNFESQFDFLDASKAGYTFDGWYEDAAFMFPLDGISQGWIGDLPLYAKFIPVVYDISYVLNDGINGANPTTYTIETPTITLAVASKVGYTFDGWFTDALFSSSISSIVLGSMGDITVYAKFSINTYDVTYETNGGSLITATEHAFDSSVFAPSSPTKVGHTFAGWYYEAGLVTQVVFPFDMPASDITLYAKWTINTYTITFDSQGGSSVLAITQDYNSSVAKPADPTKLGYTFEGWSLTVSGTLITWPMTMPAENTTVYAIWEAIDYTITYNLDGGTNALGNPMTYTIEDTITLASPTKVGYTFVGWYEDALFTEGISVIGPNEAGNITLYAQFSINQYDITFYDIDGFVISSETFDYNASLAGVMYPTAPTVSGFTFNSWSSTIPANMPAYDVDIDALYDRINYTITYVLNGGTNALGNPTTYHVESSTITLADATRTGFDFLGWYLESSFTTSIQEIPTGSTGNVTVYAKFQMILYTITFERNGGTGTSSIQAVYDALISAPADPVKTHYVFDGWYEDAALTQEFSFVGAKMPAYNFTLYAKWVPLNYAITYNLDGGTNAIGNPATYNILSSTITLLDASKVGYTFDGWYLEATFDTEVTSIPTGSFGAKTFYAKFDINEYTLSFNTNGGTAILSMDYEYLASVSAPVAPTRTGYTFDAWYYDALLTQLVTFPFAMMGENTTLYAGWDINEYTISFDSQGGTAVTAITQDYNTSVLAPTEPTRTGYTFAGWLDAVAGNPVTFPVTMGATNITLYASWDLVNYDVIYNLNGGINNIGNPSQYTFETNFTLLDPSKVGYTFDGWYEDALFTTPITAILDGWTGTLEIYAKFDIITYTITYNLDGGNNDIDNPATYQIITPTITLEDAVKVGYTFEGWYEDALFTVEISQITLGSTGNVTLYAKFSINTYTVTYETNGGNIINDVDYDFNSPVVAPTMPTKTGHQFTGWFYDSGFVTQAFFPFNMPAEDITLYARWTTLSYTVTFDSQGGSSVDPITQLYDTEVIKPVDPTKVGYTFMGWYTLSVGGSLVSWPFDMPAANQTVYAQWDINSYDVIYYAQDGTTVLQSTTYEYGSSLASHVAPTAPSITGYTFDGWVVLPATMPDADVIRTATYTIITYTITYNLDGGTNHIDNITTYTVIDSFTFKAPTKYGNAFLGWYSDALLTVEVEAIALGSTGNITLYAKWDTGEFTIHFELNGGIGTAELTATFDSTVNAPSGPFYDGFIFDGWYYDDGTFLNEFTFPASMPGEDITLYAKWIPEV